MELRHEFTVPTGVQEAWDHFQDIASVATCFPGAQVTSVDGDTFSGQVKVKLGPIALVYTGQGEFVEKDGPALVDVAHWAAEWTWLPVVEARVRAALGDTVDTRVSTVVTDPWRFRV